MHAAVGLDISFARGCWVLGAGLSGSVRFAMTTDGLGLISSTMCVASQMVPAGDQYERAACGSSSQFLVTYFRERTAVRVRKGVLSGLRY